jgi:hypothetical protein
MLPAADKYSSNHSSKGRMRRRLYNCNAEAAYPRPVRQRTHGPLNNWLAGHL